MNRSFAALSDSMRREIIEIVIKTPGISVNDLCDRFPVSRFAVMRHLNALEDAELLFRERDGKAKLLFIDQEKLLRLTTGWLTRIAKGDANDEHE